MGGSIHKNGRVANPNIPTRSGILALQRGEDVKTTLYRVMCPACGDRHDVAERECHAGGKLCPECGHNVADVIDSNVELDTEEAKNDG